MFAGLATAEPGRDGALAAGVSGVRGRTFRSGFAGRRSAGEASRLGCAGGGETPQVRSDQRCRQPAGSATFFRNRRTRTATSSGSVQREKPSIKSVSAGGEKLMRPLTLSRLLLQCAILGAILFCVMVVALKFGAVHVSLYGLGRDLLRVLMGKNTEISSNYSLILNLRLPRIFLRVIGGASLSGAGTSFQALLRNPLADPYVLGVSNGAAVGAILALLLEPHLALTPEIASVFTPLGGFLGAAIAITAVYFLGRREGRIDSSTLLLGGVITASLLSAIIILLLTTMPSSNVRGMAYWLMGELSAVPSRPLGWVLRVGFLAAAAVIYTTASDLNLLLSGEKEAMHLGVDVRRVRLIVYIAASALTGLAVAMSGSIGYVGLLVPHVMRMIFGSDHRILIPASAFGGDRKSTRLNSSHQIISYAVFCLKKKKYSRLPILA